jgi:regulator of ribonuclease activity A
MYYKTADLCDNNQNKNIQVLSPKFKPYGGKKGFYGKIITIKLNKSNWDLITLLKEENGTGKIVIIDVDEAYFGVVGDKLSAYAIENNYEALIINGYVRDTKETKTMNLGLYALGTCALRNFEKTSSSRHIKLEFGGVTFNEGDYIYADEDSIILSSNELSTKDVPQINDLFAFNQIMP